MSFGDGSEAFVIFRVIAGRKEASRVVGVTQSNRNTVDSHVASNHFCVDEGGHLRRNVIELLTSELTDEGDNDVWNTVDVEGHGQ